MTILILSPCHRVTFSPCHEQMEPSRECEPIETLVVRFASPARHAGRCLGAGGAALSAGVPERPASHRSPADHLVAGTPLFDSAQAPGSVRGEVPAHLG